MKKLFVALFVCAIFISACAPAPTPAPSTAPAQPTAAPAARTTTPAVAKTPPPNSSIAVLNIKQEKKPDGSIVTQAQIAADKIGLGDVNLSSPDQMNLGETHTIRLRLTPAQQLASLATAPAPGKTPNLPNFVYRPSGQVELYPLMYAELSALAFDMDKKGRIPQIVESGKPVEWAWIVAAKTAGHQELAIELSIPVIVNGVLSEINSKVLQNLVVTVQVAAPTTIPLPAFTPAPDTISERVSKSIADNAGAIIIALIGLIGTLIGIIAKNIADSRK